MQINKKISGIIMVFLIVTLFSVEAGAEKKIGIFTFAEETRFNEVQKGIVDQLKNIGFAEPAVKYTIENAGGSKAKAAELAQKFADSKMDLIITIGTTATLVAVKAIKDVPIVFGLVYDPIETGIARGWKSSGNNTTGASSRVPMSMLVDSLKRIAPVKRLAVLYTPGEKHTEIILKEFQKLEGNSGIRVVPVIITKKEDVAQVLPEVLRTVDAISLTGSSVYYLSLSEILDMAAKAKVITVTHIEEYVEKGALLGVSPNPYQIGLSAGAKAAKILRGAKPSSIPIEPLKKFDLIINMKTAKAGQFKIPPEFMKTVTRTIE
jgi:putative tryptophan/tyrosine transport system substrate-binding protein